MKELFDNSLDISNQLSVVVCSSDKYSDCWRPFFDLLKVNFPEIINGKIILNAEKSKFEYDDFKVHQNILNDFQIKRMGWGERLRLNIESVNTKYVLVILDDFFITESVDVNDIMELLRIMNSNSNVKNIRLVKDSTPTRKTDQNDILKVKRFARYRFSLQAALWEKDFLLKLIVNHENPWQIETFGTYRSYFFEDGFYVTNIDALKYPQGGTIHKGKWIPEIIDISNKYNLNIDYNKRGFVKINNRNLINRLKGLYLCYFKNPISFIKSVKSVILFPLSNLK